MVSPSKQAPNIRDGQILIPNIWYWLTQWWYRYTQAVSTCFDIGMCYTVHASSLCWDIGDGIWRWQVTPVRLDLPLRLTPLETFLDVLICHLFLNQNLWVVRLPHAGTPAVHVIPDTSRSSKNWLSRNRNRTAQGPLIASCNYLLYIPWAQSQHLWVLWKSIHRVMNLVSVMNVIIK